MNTDERARRIAGKIAELNKKIETTMAAFESAKGTAPGFLAAYSSNSATNVAGRQRVQKGIRNAEKAVNNATKMRANAAYINTNINTKELILPKEGTWDAIVKTATHVNEHVDKLAAAYFALAIPKLPKDMALITALSVILEVDRLHKLNSTQVELPTLKAAAITIWNKMLELRQTANSDGQARLLEEIKGSADKISQQMTHLVPAAAERLKASSSARPAGSIDRAAGFEERFDGTLFQYINRDLYTCWMENLRWDNTPGATQHTIEPLASLKEQFSKDVARMAAGLSINKLAPRIFDHDTIIADLERILHPALKDEWVEQYLPIFYVALSQSIEPISTEFYLQKFARIGLLLRQLRECCFTLQFELTGAFTFKREQHYSISRIVPVNGIPAMADLLDDTPILPDFVITTLFTFVPPVRAGLRQRPGTAASPQVQTPSYTEGSFTGSLSFECVLPELVTSLETAVKTAVTICDNFVLELMRRLPLPQQGSLLGKPKAASTANKQHKECLHQIVARMTAALAFRPAVIPTITDMTMGWNGNADTATNLIQKWERRLRAEAGKYEVAVTSDAIDAELTKKYGEHFDQVTSPAFQYCMRVQDCIDYIKQLTCAEAQDVRYVHLALNAPVKKVKGEDKGLKGTYLWPGPDFTSARREPGFYRLEELSELISMLARSLIPIVSASATAAEPLTARSNNVSATAAEPPTAASLYKLPLPARSPVGLINLSKIPTVPPPPSSTPVNTTTQLSIPSPRINLSKTTTTPIPSTATAEGGKRKHRKTIAKRVKKRHQTKKRRHY